MNITGQRLQILLKEYETCSSEAANVGTRLWQITAIFAVLVAGLGAFLAQSELLQNSELNPEAIGLGVILSIISLSWIPIYWSHRRVQNIRFLRLREIEIELGMRTNLYIHVIDACPLDIEGLRAGVYTIIVNGFSARFQLLLDNVAPTVG